MPTTRAECAGGCFQGSGDCEQGVGGPAFAGIGAAHGCSASAVALAWTVRNGTVIAIPESGSVAHVKENAVALSLTLTPQELQTLDRLSIDVRFTPKSGHRSSPAFARSTLLPETVP